MIDIIIPTNTESGLSASLESCVMKGVTQVYVISNNCSNEKISLIKDVVEGFKSAVHFHIAVGVNSARNFGLSLSRSEWVIFLDCGDSLTAIRGNEMFMQLANDNELVDLLVYDVEECGDGQPRRILKTLTEGSLNLSSIFENHMQTQTCTIRRKFLTNKGIQWDIDLKSSQDFDFYLQCIIAGPKYNYIEEIGSVRVLSSSGISADWRRTSLSEEVVLMKHRMALHRESLSPKAALRIFSVLHLNGLSKIRALLSLGLKFGFDKAKKAFIFRLSSTSLNARNE